MTDESIFSSKYYFVICTRNFCATHIESGGWKFKVHSHDKLVCPNGMHTASNSVYLVRAAAVRKC